MYKDFYVSYWNDTKWGEPSVYHDGKHVEDLVKKARDADESICIERKDVESDSLHTTYTRVSKKDNDQWITYLRANQLQNKNKDVAESLSDEQANKMLETLSKHFKCPVMPVNQYCDALRTWAEKIVDINCEADEIFEKTGEQNFRQGSSYYQYLHNILIDIDKSNLLWRMIYCGQEARTEKCPIHDGRWKGYTFEGCLYGCGECGWLPN